MRATVHFSEKTEKTHTFRDFRGTDLASSPLLCDPRDCAAGENFLTHGGQLKPRSGWKELFRLSEGEDGLPIDGIYSVPGDNRLLIAADGRFYCASPLADGGYSVTQIAGVFTESARGQAFYDGRRGYLIGGGAFLTFGVCNGTLTVQPVSEIASVPLTAEHLSDTEAADTRVLLRGANLLTRRRRNRLLGNVNYPRTYLPDALPDVESLFSLTGTVLESGASVRIEADNAQGDGKTLFLRRKNGAEVTPVPIGTLDPVTGALTLSVSAAPPVAGQDNLEIAFTATGAASTLITDCAFGTLFGASGAPARLYLSGNPDFPAKDFYSVPGDFTDFPEENSAAFGTGALALRAYGHLPDGTLAVCLRESPAAEPQIYYRTVTAEKDGTETVTAAAVRVGIGCAGGFLSVTEVGGFPRILSATGLFDLLPEAVDGTRTARLRGQAILPALLAENPEDGVAFRFSDCYYLSFGDRCYVERDGQWFRFSGVPARVFAGVGGRLLFGTAQGRVCVFDGGRTDRCIRQTEPGELSLDLPNNRFVSAFAAGEGDTAVFSAPALRALLCDSFTVSAAGRLFAADVTGLFEGQRVLCDNVQGSGLCADTPYRICDIDRVAGSFSLTAADGTPVIPTGSCRLLLPLSGKTLYVTQADANGFRLCAAPLAPPLTLVAAGAVTGLTATLTRAVPVFAVWETPDLDLGSPDCEKILHALTVVGELGKGDSFGFRTRQGEASFEAAPAGRFDLSDFSFADLSFDTGFTESVTVTPRSAGFRYIRFRFVSSGGPGGFCGLTAAYTVKKRKR